MSEIVLPPDSEIYQAIAAAAIEQRCIFFAGLPGTGKSLLLQQLALLAHQAGRVIHLLQWDVTRQPFETDAYLSRYPEIEGVTHAAIRKGVGLWARTAVANWLAAHPEPEHLLIGETPLLGNRLVELVQVIDDAAEPILADRQTIFLIPTPSTAVRAVIEAARSASLAAPQHEREEADANPAVLQALWVDVYRLAGVLGLRKQADRNHQVYDPELYALVYEYLLQWRHYRTVPVTLTLSPQGSVYDLHIVASELAASPQEVVSIMAKVERLYTPEELQAEVAGWHQFT